MEAVNGAGGRPGPLAGLRVVELAGIGPIPFAGMVLSDLGADVVRVDRPDPAILAAGPHDPTTRGKQAIVVDLKQKAGVEVVLRLAAGCDVLIEGHRPGVAERLGLGPEDCFLRNKSLVYGRMTGWGQSGPLAATAGHDINYLAVSGNLSAIGPAERPYPPLNLVADYGGGAMLLLVGVLAALIHARSTGEGQVVDAAMVDGSAMLASIIRGWLASGSWVERRESNLLDGGATVLPDVRHPRRWLRSSRRTRTPVLRGPPSGSGHCSGGADGSVRAGGVGCHVRLVRGEIRVPHP